MFKTIRRWMEPEPSPEAQWFAGRFAYCDTCIALQRSHLRFAAGDIAVHERDFGHAFEPLAERWEALALEVAKARARWPGNRNRMAAILGETNEALHAFSDGDYVANDHLMMREALDDALRLLRETYPEKEGEYLLASKLVVDSALAKGAAALNHSYEADGL